MELHPYAPNRMLDLAYLHKNYVATGLGEALRTVLQTFQSQSQQNLQTIQNAHASGNYANLTMAAHTLKGAAGSVGAFRLADGAEKLEDAAERADAVAVDRLSVELAHLTRATLAAIASILAQPQDERWPAPF
ncbi:MAG: Hpt domain-containing protein [Geobacter sp.]